jgi:hypothetical protein
MSRKSLLLSSLAMGMACVCVFAEAVMEEQKVIPPGSKVYINPIDGFEIYLVAGFQKKKVPVTAVSGKEQADFEINGTIQVQEPSKWEKLAAIGAAASGGGGADVGTRVDVAINVKNLKTGDVVFAYAWRGKRNAQQSAAEACAKHLKKKIEGK